MAGVPASRAGLPVLSGRCLPALPRLAPRGFHLAGTARSLDLRRHRRAHRNLVRAPRRLGGRPSPRRQRCRRLDGCLAPRRGPPPPADDRGSPLPRQRTRDVKPGRPGRPPDGSFGARAADHSRPAAGRRGHSRAPRRPSTARVRDGRARDGGRRSRSPCPSLSPTGERAEPRSSSRGTAASTSTSATRRPAPGFRPLAPARAGTVSKPKRRATGSGFRPSRIAISFARRSRKSPPRLSPG